MVRSEIEFVAGSEVGARTEVRPHLGLACHKLAARILLREEISRKLSGRELVLRPHDCREELLVEREPAQAVVDPLFAFPALGKRFRLGLVVEVIVYLGVLHLRLVTLLHSRNGDVPFEIIHAYVHRDDLVHADEREVVLHEI